MSAAESSLNIPHWWRSLAGWNQSQLDALVGHTTILKPLLDAELGVYPSDALKPSIQKAFSAATTHLERAVSQRTDGHAEPIQAQQRQIQAAWIEAQRAHSALREALPLLESDAQPSHPEAHDLALALCRQMLSGLSALAPASVFSPEMGSFDLSALVARHAHGHGFLLDVESGLHLHGPEAATGWLLARMVAAVDQLSAWSSRPQRMRLADSPLGPMLAISGIPPHHIPVHAMLDSRLLQTPGLLAAVALDTATAHFTVRLWIDRDLNAPLSQAKRVAEAVAHKVNLAGLVGGHLDLSGASLSGARLEGAQMATAVLKGADLSGADLFGADLSSADLTEANLRGACLRRAALQSAHIEGVQVEGADLTETWRDWPGA